MKEDVPPPLNEREPLLKFGLWNSRSVRNKTESIVDGIIHHSLDVLALTETWLRSQDDLIIGELTPPGFILHHIPRPPATEGHGGVALLLRDQWKYDVIDAGPFSSFEVLEVVIHVRNETIRIIVIYRPPPSQVNRVSWQDFINEFTDLLSHHTTTSGRLVIMGDFNIHINKSCDLKAKEFVDLLSIHNLKQHITEPTHAHGNTLDLVCTRTDDDIIDPSSVSVLPPGILSDHAWINFRANCKRPENRKKTITYRSWRLLDKAEYKNRLMRLKDEIDNEIGISTDRTLPAFINGTREIIDDLVPLKTKRVSAKPAPAWYSHEVQIERAIRRRMEKKWRLTRAEVDQIEYKRQCTTVKNLLSVTKRNYYNQQVENCNGDQKKLFKIVNSLLHRKTQSILPNSNDDKMLAEQFSDFFISKIEKIRTSIQTNDVSDDQELTPITCRLDQFEETTNEEVLKILRRTPSKQCRLDSLPTWLVKEYAAETSPFLTRIINDSLSSGEVPSDFKEAVILPLLKKPHLDRDNLANYRPVSNLNFIGKLLEKVVATRIKTYLAMHNLLEPFQSAYRSFHSTETALTKVFNDLAMAVDKKKVAILVLLDLTAAFDTIDHIILLQRCSENFGIQGKALDWLKSYITNRKQQVIINGEQSEPRSLHCGVPQGSILGPLLFIMYTSQLGAMLRTKNISFHLYADDTQLYFTSEIEDLDDQINHAERTIEMVKAWMESNMLKLNATKTEFLVISTKYHLDRLRETELKFGEDIIQPSAKARNIGVTFDPTLSMVQHINTMSSCLNYHLRNIARIRKLITRSAAEKVVHALISSRLDYCNGLLQNLPASRLRPLQMAQNTAARIITLTPRSDHITPVLMALHWLPVQARISYKTATMTFKALHGLTPDYVSDMLAPYTTIRPLRSSNTALLQTAPYSTTHGKRAFSVAAPILWNALPEEIRQCDSYETFKSKLKTLLFNQFYY